MDGFSIKADITLDGTKVYDEGIRPIIEPTAELAGLVPRAVKAAFAPVEKWILHREYSVEETRYLLNEKLKNVSPEKIVPPEPYIAVPAIEGISYCMDSEELRNLYANLLARSINLDTKRHVHPSLVEMIKQLSPIEAKVLKYISTNKNLLALCRICSNIVRNIDDPISTKVFAPGENFFSATDEGHVVLSDYFYKKFDNESPEMFSSCLCNLTRLGLLEVSYEKWFTDESHYNSFLNDGYLLSIINKPPVKMSDGNFYRNAAVKGSCLPTSLGHLFINVCVVD